VSLHDQWKLVFPEIETSNRENVKEGIVLARGDERKASQDPADEEKGMIVQHPPSLRVEVGRGGEDMHMRSPAEVIYQHVAIEAPRAAPEGHDIVYRSC